MTQQRDTRDILPEVLAAAGCAAIYCAQPEVWDQFENWLMEEKFVLPQEKINQDFMVATSRIIAELIRDVETELLAAKFQEYLSEEKNKE